MSKRADSRPPVTQRGWRTSFDLKRNRSVGRDERTNGYHNPDPDVLRTAIESAISADTFQEAIAKHLAKIIEPSIKTALDIIQPVVETVYEHELLLRKTNDGVESVLLKLESGPEGNGTAAPGDKEGDNGDANGDDYGVRNSLGVDQFKELLARQQDEHAAKLAEISNELDITNERFTEVVSGIAGLGNALTPTSDIAASLRSFSEQTRTSISVMQAQLDQLKSDSWVIIGAIGPELGQDLKSIQRALGVQGQTPSLLEKYAVKLDTISSDIKVIQNMRESGDSSETLRGISTSLDLMRESLDQSISAHAEDTASILAVVEQSNKSQASHANVSDQYGNEEILAALQKSNESHASHAAILEELRDAERQNVGQEILAVIQKLNDLQASHTSILAEIQNGSKQSSNEEVLSALERLIESHNSHAAILEEIRTSGEQSANEEILAAFEKLSEFHVSHSEALEQLKSASKPDANDDILAAIERLNQTYTAQAASVQAVRSGEEPSSNDEVLDALQKLAESHASHTATLEELRNLSGHQASNEEILGALGKLQDVYTSHSALLEEIKDASKQQSNEDILAALDKLNESHASHSAVLEEIKNAGTSERPLPVDNDRLQTLDSKVDEIITTLGTHTSTLAGLQVSPTGEPTSAAAPDSNIIGVLQPRVESILTAIDDQSKVLSEQSNLLLDIKNSDVSAEILTALHETCDTQASHAQALADIKENDVSEEILTAIHNVTETVETSAKTLKEIKDGVEGHTSTLSSIKEATDESGQSHASHSAVLQEIKGAGTTDPELLATIQKTYDLLQNHVSSVSGKDSIYDELLSNLVTMRSIVEESKSDISAAREDVKSLHESQKSATGEITNAIRTTSFSGKPTEVTQDKAVLDEALAEPEHDRSAPQTQHGAASKEEAVAEIPEEAEATEVKETGIIEPEVSESHEQPEPVEEEKAEAAEPEESGSANDNEIVEDDTIDDAEEAHEEPVPGSHEKTEAVEEQEIPDDEHHPEVSAEAPPADVAEDSELLENEAMDTHADSGIAETKVTEVPDIEESLQETNDTEAKDTEEQVHEEARDETVPEAEPEEKEDAEASQDKKIDEAHVEDASDKAVEIPTLPEAALEDEKEAEEEKAEVDEVGEGSQEAGEDAEEKAASGEDENAESQKDVSAIEDTAGALDEDKIADTTEEEEGQEGQEGKEEGLPEIKEEENEDDRATTSGREEDEIS